jgi:hypothetical protein
MIKWMNSIKIVSIVLIIWTVQNAHLIAAYLKYDTAQTEFSSFVYKGSMGFAMDNTAYGNIIRYLSFNPSLIRPDNLIFENGNTVIADGNIVLLFPAFVQQLTANLDLTVLITSFLAILLSVLLIIRIAKLSFPKVSWMLVFISSVLVFLTNITDLTGLVKAFGNLNDGHVYKHFSMHMGYAQRFPFAQISIVFFLYWISALLQFLKSGSIKNSFILGVSVLLLQYSYFYYWSFAIALTGIIFLFHIRKFKQWIPAIVLYLICSFPFWYVFVQFNQLEFAKEFLFRIKGIEYYPTIWINIIGWGIGLVVLRNKPLIPVCFSLGYFIAAQLGIEFLENTFQPFHWAYNTGKALIAIGWFVNLIWVLKQRNSSTIELISLFSYWLIFVFINLHFFIGYNVQPYHWVLAAFHPVYMLFLTWLAWKLSTFEKTFFSISAVITLVVLYNAFCFGNTAGKYWHVNQEESAIIQFVNQQKSPPVLSGNNYPFLVTLSAHTNCFLFMGTTNNKRSSYPESYYRFNHNFKNLGYSDSLIIDEYNRYKNCNTYQRIYEEDNDSLALVWPDNTFLTAEALHHYFVRPANLLPDFKAALKEYPHQDYHFKNDYIIIYKPTFRGRYDVFKSDPVFKSENFLIYLTTSIL